MHSLDASAIVHGWDNYRLNKFPKLWAWLEDEMHAGNLIISSVALVEVDHVSPECHQWLHGKISKETISSAMLTQAITIKTALGISDDQYNSKGVDENDLLIIANAKVLGATLISNENIQIGLPPTLSKYKIPAVCQHIANVSCISFLDYINQTTETF